MTNKDPLLLDQQLCFALYSTSLAMTKVYKPLLEEVGLTYPQYLMMLVLWENDRLPLKELARRLHQDSGALTPVLKRLEAEGYVTRQRNAEDERNLSIELTEAGRALRERAREINGTISGYCALGDAQMNALRENLMTLRAKLER
ncbi:MULTISPECIES: MarR family winged helix-turn-helix transcriptional regulator [Pseudomonas]|uniref:MarR family transcriptional regulator n=2 Tax=Pseudomonas TaxID=286 RepID=A0A178L7N5_9PSED|nr:MULTISPECIES: MarR family transcriptional regulator [Pseudomonas]MCD4866804.1 MarR family transcriptional regulator [Pseudomonas sp. PLB05]NRH43869.1 MarR family transcriptional regulator [Pseudomonas sp. MS15a(2019)]OAN24913.1 MarR family transcriptional regulator [Pseudomonas oryzihabitans]